jgi:L-2-hydroxyglutarate oxidase
VIYDHCVIGGGIVGLASAMALLEKRPGSSVLVLEKEADTARHQTGHNSGVIHSGIYYEPGSLKAELSRRGAVATKEFCAEHGLPMTVQGKLLVASDERDAQRLEALVERAAANRIEVQRLSAAELHELEPASAHCSSPPRAASTTWRSPARCRRSSPRAAAGWSSARPSPRSTSGPTRC